MFADAYSKAREFTAPIVTFSRLRNGRINTSIGAAFLINREGWILTAAHVVKSILDLNNAKKKVDEREAKRAEITNSDSLSFKDRSRALKDLGRDSDDDVVDLSVVWPFNSVGFSKHFTLEPADLCAAQLLGYVPDENSSVATIKDPAKGLRQGTSLCKLGFPLYGINTGYDERAKSFVIPPRAFPMPLFPLDGIYTRQITVEFENSGQPSGIPVSFIETSTPGLPGHSGGPIFDVHGAVWAVQSATSSYYIGFDPDVPGSGAAGAKPVKAHQFLNVGVGAGAETIVALLRQVGVPFTLSDH